MKTNGKYNVDIKKCTTGENKICHPMSMYPFSRVTDREAFAPSIYPALMAPMTLFTKPNDDGCGGGDDCNHNFHCSSGYQIQVSPSYQDEQLPTVQ